MYFTILHQFLLPKPILNTNFGHNVLLHRLSTFYNYSDEVVKLVFVFFFTKKPPCPFFFDQPQHLPTIAFPLSLIKPVSNPTSS